MTVSREVILSSEDRDLPPTRTFRRSFQGEWRHFLSGSSMFSVTSAFWKWELGLPGWWLWRGSTQLYTHVLVYLFTIQSVDTRRYTWADLMRNLFMPLRKILLCVGKHQTFFVYHSLRKSAAVNTGTDSVLIGFCSSLCLQVRKYWLCGFGQIVSRPPFFFKKRRIGLLLPQQREMIPLLKMSPATLQASFLKWFFFFSPYREG